MNEEEQKRRADLAFSQGLWYAWGRIDSGQYKDKKPLDPFKFAESVKANQIAFDTEASHYNESIQGQWNKFVEANS